MDSLAHLLPPRLKSGDRIRFVSPASTPDKDAVLRAAAILEGWGLAVEFGTHAFARQGYLAGSDDERLADLNAALRDPAIRAIFATRGGKGSYRIADRLDFAAARTDPKFLVGFSDITILHLKLWQQCRLVGIHGALVQNDGGAVDREVNHGLRRALMTDDRVIVRSRPEESTSALTTGGAATGRLIGGNLDMIATAAGWALPDLRGAILLVEIVNCYIGQIDRQLTMLRKAGHLAGIAGIAIGQLVAMKGADPAPIIDMIRDHLARLDVPVLGGLPLGHGAQPASVPIGLTASLDAGAGELRVR